MRSASTEAYWKSFQRHGGVNDDNYQVTRLKTEPAVARRLVEMVVAGAKRGLAGPMHYFGEGCEESVPTAGDHVMLLDHKNRPHLIWRTRSARVAPLSSVTDRHVWTDGEGRGDRNRWLAAIGQSFAAQARQYRFEMHDDIATLFETFDVVWPLEVANRLALLVPLLERSFDVRERLDEWVNGLEAVLNRVQTAIFTLGGDMSLQYANPAGEELLRRADGIVLKGRFVSALGATNARALELAAAACTLRETPRDAGTGYTAGRVVTIRRTGDLAAYRATVLPLRRDHAVGDAMPAAEILLFVDDPDAAGAAAPADEVLFRQSFRLTPAEARLAACLASGEALSAAAEMFGTTKNTVRVQLQAVFDKTEARRQSDLVRLLQAARSLRVSLS
jgi:uncharacterized protein YhfF/DNA-binding CsgD family transcriptional regulator